MADYLKADEVDYIRLRWFFRRLAQVGHPGAIRTVIEKIELLEPCIPSVCSYISSIQGIPPEDWEEIGNDLLACLQRGYPFDNEFARLSVLSLFSRNEHVDHFGTLARSYGDSDGWSRREILLAARANSQTDWLREHKEGFGSMDPWQQLAFIYCASIFPKDERQFFLRGINCESPFDRELLRLARTGGI